MHQVADKSQRIGRDQDLLQQMVAAVLLEELQRHGYSRVEMAKMEAFTLSSLVEIGLGLRIGRDSNSNSSNSRLLMKTRTGYSNRENAPLFRISALGILVSLPPHLICCWQPSIRLNTLTLSRRDADAKVHCHPYQAAKPHPTFAPAWSNRYLDTT